MYGTHIVAIGPNRPSSLTVRSLLPPLSTVLLFRVEAVDLASVSLLSLYIGALASIVVVASVVAVAGAVAVAYASY